MPLPTLLAISTTGMGDTLLSLPCLAALARSHTVDFLLHKRHASLVNLNPHIRQAFSYRNNALFRWGLGMTLGLRPYSRVLVLHGNSDILKLLPRLDYKKAANLQGWQDPNLRLEALEPDLELHVEQRRLKLAVWAGADPVDSPMRVFLSAKEVESGEAWLAKKGLKAGDLRVAFCPGAALPYKRWSVDRFARVAEELHKSGAGVLVVGSKEERGLYSHMAKRCPGAVPALGLDLRLTAALLQKVDLLITNDTGPMHLALAVQTKVLAIFGPSQVKAYGPREPGSRVLQVPLCCQPCRTKACLDPLCLNELSQEEVLQNAREMLRLA